MWSRGRFTTMLTATNMIKSLDSRLPKMLKAMKVTIMEPVIVFFSRFIKIVPGTLLEEDKDSAEENNLENKREKFIKEEIPEQFCTSNGSLEQEPSSQNGCTG